MECGSYGPEKYRYHSAAGDPVVDGRKFPNLRGLTDLAHSLGLTAGWYGNACVSSVPPPHTHAHTHTHTHTQPPVLNRTW